ncbi:MAG TPA: AAA family ATPase, partial [Thermoplasmata archaeon]
MEESIFQPYIATRPIFRIDRDILRPSFVPDRLPHREEQVDQLAQILATALRGDRPSNVLIYGQTGTGKTAVVKYIENEFKKLEGGRTVHYMYLNCEIVDTPYAVLQNLANRFVENFSQRVPFTGLSTDRVYQMLCEKLDEEKRIVILVLDEIDKIITKNGDDLLYQLLKINEDLTRAKLSLIGISNDLKFTEYLDPRVKSRLSDEKMVFPPYNAEELFDILSQR